MTKLTLSFPYIQTQKKHSLFVLAFFCTAAWIFFSTIAYAVDKNNTRESEQERLRNLSIYKTLDKMDEEKGETATRTFILEEIPRLMGEKYSPDSGDKLRALFIWLRDWADRGKNPAYGFLYAEHLYAILLNKNNNLQQPQAEDIAQQALQSYYLSFQLMREDMSRCGGDSQTYIGNALFIPIITRFKLYKELYDAMKAHQKRAIVRYVLEKSDALKNRKPHINFCKKSVDDNAPELIADDVWLKLRDQYRAEFQDKLAPPND